MISKNSYLNELCKYNLDKKTTLYDKFIYIYDLYQSGGFLDFDAAYLVDELLVNLFSPLIQSSDFSIPVNFINSPIGHVLFSVKFSNSTDLTFTISDICAMLNCTRGLISLDIKNNKLLPVTVGNNRYIIPKNNLITYLQQKGLTEISSKNLIHKFLELKNKNLSLSEITDYLKEKTI